jgi:hypothetical protein
VGKPSPPLDPVADARSTPRRLARCSIAAPFVIFLLQIVVRYLERTRQLDLEPLSSNIAALLMIAGLVCGIIAVIGALRLRSRDTLIIALLGLFLGGCWLLITVWAMVFVWGR